MYDKKMGTAYVGSPHLFVFLRFQNWVDCRRVEPAIKFPLGNLYFWELKKGSSAPAGHGRCQLRRRGGQCVFTFQRV